MTPRLRWAPIYQPDRQTMLDVLSELVQAGLDAAERPDEALGSSETPQDLAELAEVAA